jgi:succinyl-diaminopimelate desuccinylase
MTADAATRSEGDAAARHEAAAEELAERLFELASIRSVSRQERELADWLEARLRAPGREVLRTGDNLVVTLPALLATGAPGKAAPSEGGPAKPLLLLCGHLDTVPENGNFPPRREGDLIHGLGTTDLKSGLAVLWHLLDELSARLGRDGPLAARIPCTLGFVFYAREEVAYAESGLVEVERAWPLLRQAALAVCVEPTANAVELGCNGTLHAEVTVRGKAAHAARPWLGRNAIHEALPLLAKIARRPERRHSPIGRPELEYREVMSVTGVSGGRARNVVPDACSFHVNFRFAPDRTEENARSVVAELVGGGGEIAWRDVAPAGRAVSGNPLCDRLIALAGAVRAKQAWTDVGRLSSWGVDAVSFGPGFPELAHQQGEYASIAKMVESRRILRALLELKG